MAWIIAMVHAERRGLDPLRPESEIVVQQVAPERPMPEPAASKRDRLKQRVRAAAQRRAGTAPDPVAADAAPAPLLPAPPDAWGRDSQGRGTTPAEVAAVAERSEGVRKALGDLGLWVSQAYRDPDAAVQRLEALEAAEGGPKGAERALRRHDGGPELLGELRGKAGWFASAASKAEREVAVRCAGSVGGGLLRLREAEERAGQGYVRDVEAQRVRDGVEVPGLSPAAWAAVRAVEQAGDAAEREAKAKPGYSPVWDARIARQGGAVAEAWAREVAGKPAVAAELRAVAEAAGQRLGEDGVRELVWGARGAQDGPEQREGLAGVGRVLAAFGEGQRAFAAQQDRAREAERERLGLRQGRGMRM